MRCSIVLSLVFLVAALTPTIGHAQTKDRLIIEKVRVGLPGGRKIEAGKYKAGFWTPIYVDLTIGPEDIPAGQADVVLNDEDLMDNSNRRFAAIDQLEQMPTHWFGYQAVDVMVLTSGNADFIKRLSADRSGRLDALTGWVRRGGRLIISAGHNQQ